MIGIQEIIKKSEELHPLPRSACKLAEVVASAKSSVDDIVTVIEYDQALTIDVLKFANSVFSSSNTPVSSIKNAVIRLGGARILEQIVARNVKNSISKPVPSYGYSEDELWRHSVASATAAEIMNSFVEISIEGVAFTAALLHDIGKLVLGRNAGQAMMDRVWQRVVNESCTCAEAEYFVFGFTHADIGAEIMAQWKLPEIIITAVKYHHSLDENVALETDCVRIANMVARSIGEGIGYEGMQLAVDSSIQERLGLSRENFEKLCASTKEKLDNIMEMYG
ncbi:MAG: HDOD domain-containing protein [Chitinivibrionales bacterium]|nr:HDOD domain-containing protein [Chitinivibrionales bacterium]